MLSSRQYIGGIDTPYTKQYTECSEGRYYLYLGIRSVFVGSILLIQKIRSFFGGTILLILSNTHYFRGNSTIHTRAFNEIGTGSRSNESTQDSVVKTAKIGFGILYWFIIASHVRGQDKLSY